jgi:SAM-dependent methyltransferase
VSTPPPEQFVDWDLLFATPHYIVERSKRARARQACAMLVGHVVDVGCGWSQYRPFLISATRYTGVDVERGMAAVVLGSAMSLPLRTASADCVMATEVLEHLPSPCTALAEAKRVLRPGGRLYVTAPMSWGLHQLPHDYYRFTHLGLAHMLRSSGFRVDLVEPIGGLFSLFAARIADYLHSTLVDGPLARLGMVKGRLRAGALLLSGYNLLALPVCVLLDRTWTNDVIGWAVLATKEDSDEAG